MAEDGDLPQLGIAFTVIIEDTSTDEIVDISPDGTTLTFSGDKDLGVLEGDY